MKFLIRKKVMRIHGATLRCTPYSPHFTRGSPKFLGWIFKLHDFGAQTHCIWMPNPMTLDAKLNDFAIQSLCFWKNVLNGWKTREYKGGI
ncbi:hypothetical protein HMPREF2140_08645 [Hoylesella buccalis DNF00985]|nr:hypothetical protein HMPREF2140_08645 [Hoylesella buccalis DNF00985]